MYYRDQYGNVVEYSPEGMGQYSNSGGVGYHPLTREDYSFTDVTTWFEKYKMWFVYALLVVVVFIVLMWLWNNRNRKTAASVFY